MGPRLNTWFLGLTQVHNPNEVSVGSVVLARLMEVRDRLHYFVCNNRSHSTAMRAKKKEQRHCLMVTRSWLICTTIIITVIW